MTNHRKAIIDLLVPHFREDERYLLLVCDMGFGVMDNLKREFPRRVVNCGIMEGGTVGIAAGLAMSGWIPVVYCIVNFLVFRSLEQIRNDVVQQRLNVKFIGTGADDFFRFLGPSHCCGRKDVEIFKIIELKTYDPYASATPIEGLVREWIQSKEAGYIRV